MSAIDRPPHIENAFGLIWLPRANGAWHARWQARTDLVKRGYTPKMIGIWTGKMPLTEPDKMTIAMSCQAYQARMLDWSKTTEIEPKKFDGTVEGLCGSYMTDPAAKFGKKKYVTRVYYESLMRRIITDHGSTVLKDIRPRDLVLWHETWTGRGVSMAHSLMGMLRTLCGYGVLLEDAECTRLAIILSKLKFTIPVPNKERLTAEQATMIRDAANERSLHSIALAQAFQFDCTFRQKDVIGEWVPITEVGTTDEMIGNRKWLAGIRWSEIDGDLVLRHVTSKRQKAVEIDLKLCPMVTEELARFGGALPRSGPVIVDERFGRPWEVTSFRQTWRALADECGIPKAVKNMHSRAGGITEGIDAGAPVEHVSKMATHADVKMTQHYNRGDLRQKTDNVLKMRAASRVNKSGTDTP